MTVPQGLHRTREKKAVRTITFPCLTETETQVNEIKLDSKTDELMKTFLNTGPKYCPKRRWTKIIAEMHKCVWSVVSCPDSTLSQGHLGMRLCGTINRTKLL